ncbi:Wadjet anti-phage system protein JetD domain-containing protein [Pseudomonas sp. CGJS7]|uniref:Wadjet anti-phage system protein JetD domain-containing protein n=1 Tax=Pseudomonas sp. CGJS7 TaxID=3109348 RepID=UPI003009AEF6
MSGHFLNRLHAHPKKRIALAELRQMWLTVHPEQVEHPERDSLMLETLSNYAEHGYLALPAANSFEKVGHPRMPKFVTLITGSRHIPTTDWAALPWLPELGFWPLLKNSEKQVAFAINEWLRRPKGRGLFAPLRERALEIFGDEKFLDLRVRNDALFAGRLPLTILRTFLVSPPLPHKKANAPGRPAVIVENHHTYWSLSEWNVDAKRYATVIYGSGYAVSSTSRALDEILREVNGTSVLYFGDLDPEGIAIPLRIQSAGASEICPDIDLYELALAHGRRRYEVHRLLDDISTLHRWIPSLATEVETMWMEGQWIPQEGVGIELLHERGSQLLT